MTHPLDDDSPDIAPEGTWPDTVSIVFRCPGCGARPGENHSVVCSWSPDPQGEDVEPDAMFPPDDPRDYPDDGLD